LGLLDKTKQFQNNAGKIAVCLGRKSY
jgi:hypothetical protein